MALQQRQKQSVGQRLAVVQKVLEYGVASVLEQRRAFPPDFFVHGTLDGTSLLYSRFDEAWLNDDESKSPGSSASRSSRSDGDTSSDGDGDSTGRGDDDDTTIPEKPISRKRSRIGSTNSSTSIWGGGKNPPPVPPANAPGRDHRRPADRFASSAAATDEINANDGAPPLLVGGEQATISQLLPPLSVLPSASSTRISTSSSHKAAARPMTTVPTTVVEEGGNDIDRMRSEALILLQWIRDGAATVLRHNTHSRVVVGICCPGATRHDKDRLVESLAFDITRDVNLLRTRNVGVDESAVKREVQGILRNIHSSSNFGGAAAVACPLPNDRYFTFRVEFSRPVPQNLLPPSLDANSPHFGKLEQFGRVLAADDAIPQTRWEPSADRRTLQRLHPFQLGRVDGKVFGLQMVAFCGKDERVLNDRPGPRCTEEKSADQAAPADSLLVLPEAGTIVMAFPHGVSNAMAGTIIDVRVTKKERRLKIRFHGPIQQPKQWICSSMAVSSTISNSKIQKAGQEAGLSRTMFGSSATIQRDIQGRKCYKRTRFSYLCEPIRVVL